MKSNPIVLNDGRIGRGISVKDYNKLFVKEGFRIERGREYAKQWRDVGMIIQGDNADDGFIAYIFPELSTRENMDFENTVKNLGLITHNLKAAHRIVNA